MSEFQVYKFLSVDKPLSSKEQKEISRFSSRTIATSNSATFTYAYGDFPKDETSVLKKYFDIFLYFSNWGTKRLILKFPLHLVDYKNILAFDIKENYYSSNELTISRTSDFLIITFEISDDEGGCWVEEEDFNASDFTSIREAILDGNNSALYLFWMKVASSIGEEYEEEEIDDKISIKTPPIPVELSKINAALQKFINFFEIDKDLVKAAQSTSKKLNHLKKEIDYAKLLEHLTIQEKNDYLLRILKKESRLDLTLRQHLDRFTS